MQSLALDNLKLEKKHVQFLPQLSFKKLDRTYNQNKTSRPSHSKAPQTPIQLTERL